MIQDLHSHTYYSFCGKDSPEKLIEKAIDGGIELLGICDHNYGIGIANKSIYKSGQDIPTDDYGPTLVRYYDHISLLKEKYKDKIKLLRGIEIATTLTRPHILLPDSADVSFFDYALVEHIENIDNSSIRGDIFGFAERLGCPTGIAHTDLFNFIESIGEKPLDYLRRMAELGIFWELNVNYDSIHKYVEHGYVKKFFEDRAQQETVLESGIKLSVGFDSHRADEYLPERIRSACDKLTKLGIPMIFEE